MRIIILAGAGLSAPSGIPTFEEKWAEIDVKKVGYIGQEHSKESHLFFDEFREILKNVSPSQAHVTIAEITKMFPTKVYTMNIDDLLEKAGCTDVEHLHGKANEVMCSNCQEVFNLGYNSILQYDACPSCFKPNMLRTNVKMYGEKTNYYNLIDDIINLNPEDIFITIGTSGKTCNMNTIIRPIRCTKINFNIKESKYLDTTNFINIYGDCCETLRLLPDIIKKKIYCL